MLRIFKKLWKGLGAAADSEMSVVHIGEIWAMEEYMFSSLKGLTAMASYLVWGVLWEEVLHVFAREGVSCGETIEC